MNKADILLLQHELSPILGSHADLVDSLKSLQADADVRDRAERILKRLREFDKLLADLKTREDATVR